MKRKIRIEYLVAVILIGIFTTLLLLASPQVPGVYRSSFTDSSVFRYIGMAMTRGELPYRDIFDHKGILLYVINYIGYRISPVHGIWILEWGSVFTAILFSWLSLKRMVQGKVLPAFGVLCSYAWLLLFYDGGNLAEEFCLPFLAIALYIFTDYFMAKKVSALRITVAGASFGYVLLIRPNEIGLWIVCCFAVLLFLLFQKHVRDLFFYMGWFLGGTAFAILPFVLYMGKEQIWKDFYECYITFNFQYTGSSGGNLQDIWNAAIVLFGKSGVFLPGFIGIFFVLWNWRKRKEIAYRLLIILLCNYFGNIILIVISGRTYPHYGITILPIVCGLLGAIFLQMQESAQKTETKAGWRSAVSVLLAILLCIPSVQRLPQNIQNYRMFSKLVPSDSELVYTLRNNTWSGERICVLGNSCNIYLEADRMSAVRQIYQSEDLLYEEKLLVGFYQELKESRASAIVLRKQEQFITEKLWPIIESYVQENYSLVFEDQENMMYIRKQEEV